MLVGFAGEVVDARQREIPVGLASVEHHAVAGVGADRRAPILKAGARLVRLVSRNLEADNRAPARAQKVARGLSRRLGIDLRPVRNHSPADAPDIGGVHRTLAKIPTGQD